MGKKKSKKLMQNSNFNVISKVIGTQSPYSLNHWLSSGLNWQAVFPPPPMPSCETQWSSHWSAYLLQFKACLHYLWWSFLPLWLPALYVICTISGRSTEVWKLHTYLHVCPPSSYSVVSLYITWAIFFELLLFALLPTGVCAPWELHYQMW